MLDDKGQLFDNSEIFIEAAKDLHKVHEEEVDCFGNPSIENY